MKKFYLAAALCAALVSASGPWAAEKVYYRYTNEHGVTVINDRIPPEYVPLGYEVVTIGGTVVRTVAPAPSKEELERRAQERELAEERQRQDAELRRRYSTVADILAAKERRLNTLQSNIAVLEGNVNSVRARARNMETRAAGLERSGREVPESILEGLASLNQEEQDLLQQIEQRTLEYQETAQSFDRDIARFEELINQQRANP